MLQKPSKDMKIWLVLAKAVPLQPATSKKPCKCNGFWLISMKAIFYVKCIMAYATLRRLTGHPCWSDDFERDLTEAARAIVENGHSDLPSTYYAMLWLDIYENGPTREPYTPRVSEWLTCSPTLPVNPKIWKPTLANGCMGAMLSRMNTDRHEHLSTQ